MIIENNSQVHFIDPLRTYTKVQLGEVLLGLANLCERNKLPVSADILDLQTWLSDQDEEALIRIEIHQDDGKMYPVSGYKLEE